MTQRIVDYPYGTGNPVLPNGSSDVRDGIDNLNSFDVFVNAPEDTYNQRRGNIVRTISGMNTEFNNQILSMGFTRVGTFAAGGTLTNPRQTLLWDVADGGDGQEYGWSGAFPKIVPASSSPLTTGGISVGAWMSRFDPELRTQTREALRRSYAESGYNLVDGSFEVGGTLVNSNDVLLHEATGKAFTGPAGLVAAGTSPTSGGFTDVSGMHEPALVDAYLLLTMTDTDAIDAAMSANKSVTFKGRKYTYTKELVTNGHTLLGVVSETFGDDGTVIEFDIPVTPLSGFAVRNISRKSSYSNINFIQKNWSISLNGFKPERPVSTYDVDFSYFNGHGIVLTSVDSLSQVSYGTLLQNPTCDYNAKHGILLGGGANSNVIINPKCRFNGSPSYGTQPSNPGLYDGICSSGKNSEYQGNPLINNDPQGNNIIGGDLSYNSRIGLNLDRFFDGAIVGGYGELNRVADIKIRNTYGSSVLNFMSQQNPDVVVPSTDTLSGLNLSTYPNRIIIRGKSYGNGQISSTAGVYEQFMDAPRTSGSLGSMRITPTIEGGILFTKAGGNAIKLHCGDVPFIARNAAFGDGYANTDTVTRLSPAIKRAGNVEGDEALAIESAGQFFKLFIANGSGASTTATGMLVPKNSVTNRSINAGGTVNTSGADYAEYMTRSELCGVIQKGDICGVDGDGLLTTTYDNAVSFVIKSTNPSFVGGDAWFTDPEPEPPIIDGIEDREDPAFTVELDIYNKAKEVARRKVERIAFSGQVPCNVYGATPGDYIIPTRNPDGTIGAMSITTPSFEQYQKSVGMVWKICNDREAWVAVKIV